MNMHRKLQASKYLRMVPRHDGYALYHSLYGGLCVVDEDILHLFDVFRTPQSVHDVLDTNNAHDKERLASFMEVFQERGFLVEQGFRESSRLEHHLEKVGKDLHRGAQVGVVQLVLTNLCNFRCEYCFVENIYVSEERFKAQASESNRIMRAEDARVYLEKVIDLAKRNGRTALSVQFFGGEPLINWEVMKFVLEYFGSGERQGLDISYSIVTNGSLITEEIAEYCKKYKVSVIVSFDAPSGKQRRCTDGKNSGELIERSLSLLNKHYNRVAFNAVLSSETFEVFGVELVVREISNYCTA